MKKRFKAPAIILISLIIVCAAMLLIRSNGKPKEFIRTVTALQLQNSDPNEIIKATGIVTPWKEEDISFEVGGRIQWVITRNTYVKNSKDPYSLAHNGSGQLLAKINQEDYKLSVKTTQAQAAAAAANVAAKQIEIKQVIKHQLEAARADAVNGEREYKRQLMLKNKKVVSDKTFEESETKYKVAMAKYSELKAQVNVRIAALKAEKAKLEQLQQTVKDAELDLKHTSLRAPFSGKTAAIYADIGAYVRAGEKVVRLIAMDPLIVKLDVSPELERKFYYGQCVQVYPAGIDKPVVAMVNHKASVADQNTFTYNLELLVRNDIVNVVTDLPESIKTLPEIESVAPIGTIKVQGKEQTLVMSSCLQKDDKGSFIWLAKKAAELIAGAPVYRITKQYVKCISGERNILGEFKYKLIHSDDPTFKPPALAATGVPKGFSSGSTAVLIRKRRTFRPGDLVKVILQAKNVLTGIYIPPRAVCSDTRETWVYKILRRKDGSAYTRKITVKISGQFNDYLLIRSPELKPGDQIVNDGAQFVSTDENINIKSTELVKL